MLERKQKAKPYIAYYLSLAIQAGEPKILRRANRRCYAHVLCLHPMDLERVSMYFRNYSLIRLRDEDENGSITPS